MKGGRIIPQGGYTNNGNIIWEPGLYNKASGKYPYRPYGCGLPGHGNASRYFHLASDRPLIQIYNFFN